MYRIFEANPKKSTTPTTSEEAISALWRIDEIILNTSEIEKLAEKIVNVMLEELGYLNLGYVIIVLSLLDGNKKTLKRISISQTEQAKNALDNSPVPFSEISFSLEDKENLSVKSLNDHTPYITEDLSDMLYPSIDREKVREVQGKLGIQSSLVFPIYEGSEPLGTIIFSLNKTEDKISEFEKQILIGFTNAAGIAISHAYLINKLNTINQKLIDLDKQKDEFLSMAAHELRAPMTAIKGYVSMVLEGDTGEIPEKARGFLADTSNITDRLIRLVNNMLNVGRIEEGRMTYQEEEEHLAVPMRSVFNQFTPEAERKNLKYTIEIPNELKDKVLVDPDRIQEVVGNFISNSIKYTNDGFVKVVMSQPNPETVRVEVVDSGTGIAPEEQTNLFQKFHRVESNVGKTTGTGLGLYISKLLVEKFHGKIGINSELGKGSTFWFELPLVS